jgi:hypothetical protein
MIQVEFLRRIFDACSLLRIRCPLLPAVSPCVPGRLACGRLMPALSCRSDILIPQALFLQVYFEKKTTAWHTYQRSVKRNLLIIRLLIFN